MQIFQNKIEKTNTKFIQLSKLFSTIMCVQQPYANQPTTDAVGLKLKMRLESARYELALVATPALVAVHRILTLHFNLKKSQLPLHLICLISAMSQSGRLGFKKNSNIRVTYGASRLHRSILSRKIRTSPQWGWPSKRDKWFLIYLHQGIIATFVYDVFELL